MKISMRSTVMALTFLCLAAGPNSRAVTPPPDGGYPGANTAEGQNALFALTTGGYNTAVGYLSIRSNAIGSFNTAIGAGTLFANNADNNTATGAGALFSNTMGTADTANGAFALFSNGAGAGNTASGYQALFNNQGGGNNTAFGRLALYSNTAGNNNIAIGSYALAISSGNNNIAIGYFAGQAITSGSNNIDIGADGVNGESGTIRIGAQGTQTATFIAGISGTGVMGTGVMVDGNGQLGVALSSNRFKDDIKPMDTASKAILALKPVTFRYKQEIDPDRVPQFGLVAEEVEKVNAALVTRDRNGKPYTVRYEAVNAMLLNEFLKEHKAFLEEQKKVERLEAALAAVNQTLKQQEAKIARVSAQVEVNKPAAQMVLNTP